EEAVGMSVIELIPEDLRHEEPVILDRISRGLPIEHYETIRQRKDGSLLEVSLSVSPIRDEKGVVVAASQILRDITARKASERQLAAVAAELEEAKNALEVRVLERTAALTRAIEQMEEFSYTVSHDLRAPLRAMRTYSQVLLEEYGTLFESSPDAQ